MGGVGDIGAFLLYHKEYSPIVAIINNHTELHKYTQAVI